MSGYLANLYSTDPIEQQELLYLMRAYSLTIWIDLITGTALIGMKCTGKINALLVILFGVFVPIVFVWGLLNLKYLGLGAQGFVYGMGLGECFMLSIALIYLTLIDWEKVEIIEEKVEVLGSQRNELDDDI